MLLHRPRRLRKLESIRRLVQETHLNTSDLITPLFIEEGTKVKASISSMPDYMRFSIDEAVKEVKYLWDLGIPSILLFTKIDSSLKDNTGAAAWNPNGLMQRGIKALKEAIPELLVLTDVALDPYSIYGQDGLVENNKIVNDKTVEALVKMSLSHIAAGADGVAPSDMMDGRIGAIRHAFESNGFTDAIILAYSAKYNSCFYGPFRSALDSNPGFGDKKTYQMDCANALEALKEVQLDIKEGADMVMVKPALAYLDIIQRIKKEVNIPVCAYQVSGEYAMIKTAAAAGLLDEKQAILETSIAMKRAGADIIVSYFAKDIAIMLNT